MELFFSPKGRLQNWEYFGATAAKNIVFWVISLILKTAVQDPHLVQLLSMIFLGISLWISFALISKRLHDMNLSSFYIFIAVGLLITDVFLTTIYMNINHLEFTFSYTESSQYTEITIANIGICLGAAIYIPCNLFLLFGPSYPKNNKWGKTAPSTYPRTRRPLEEVVANPEDLKT